MGGGGGGGVVRMRNVAECHARRMRLPQSLPPGGEDWGLNKVKFSRSPLECYFSDLLPPLKHLMTFAIPLRPTCLHFSKSTCLADIPARLLKEGSGAIARPLTVLMNRSLAEGSIPLEWKHATVKPVHNLTLERVQLTIYRPISVLPVFSKILERAVHKLVYTFLRQHNLLSVYQSGFRSLQSSSTCLTDITNTLLQNIDKGQLTGLVFLDLTKAFDTLDHSILLDKLASLEFSKASVMV